MPKSISNLLPERYECLMSNLGIAILCCIDSEEVRGSWSSEPLSTVDGSAAVTGCTLVHALRADKHCPGEMPQCSQSGPRHWCDPASVFQAPYRRMRAHALGMPRNEFSRLLAGQINPRLRNRPDTFFPADQGGRYYETSI